MFGLFRRASSFGRGSQVSARPNFAPQVEPLEDRSTPATFNIANGDVAGLVAAITTANTNALPDTINLPAGGTFTLTAVNNTTSGTNGLPVILADGGNGLTINGNGSTIARDAAAPNFRILEVNNGSAPLAISGVTISGGKNPGNDGGGILVDSNANLTLTAGTVTGNTTNTRGGGIGTESGSVLTVTGSTITGNTSNRGGGISLYVATANIQTSTIAGNVSGNRGGGAFLYRANVTVLNTTISGNTSASRGGGADLYRCTGLIQNCTIANNTAANRGGGLFLYKGTNTIANTTITGNSATGAGGFGGGVHLYAGTQTLVNCTITGNTASQNGGGVYIQPGTVANLRNTIVAGNTDKTGANDIARTGGTLNASNNLIQNLPFGTINGTNTANITWMDPLLGPLQNNGGPTQTRALSANSPAINAGSTALATAAGLTTDQRGAGYARTDGAGTDIGAFELQPPTVTAVNPVSGPSAGGTAVTITGTNLTGTIAVFFGSTAATGFTVNSPTSVTAVAPAGAGAVDVAVVTRDGTSAPSAADQFTYVAPAVPLSPPPLSPPPLSPPPMSPPPAPPPPPPPAPVRDPIVLTRPGAVGVLSTVTGQQTTLPAPFGNIPANAAVGDLTGDGVPDFAFVPGPGGGPVLNLVNGANGNTIVNLLALPSTDFRGGLTVAVGTGLVPSSPTGRGPVVAVGAGAGGGPFVRVFDATTLQVVAEFFAFSPALRTGVTVALADVNGDGVDDLIVGTGPGVAAQVEVVDGTKLGTTVGGVIAPAALFAPAFAPFLGFTGGVSVAAGNLDGDGFADVVVTPGAGGGPVYATYFGKDLKAGVVNPVVRPGLSNTALRTGLGVAVADVNGDGVEEVLLTPGAGGGPAVLGFDAVTGAQTFGTFVGNPNDRTGGGSLA